MAIQRERIRWDQAQRPLPHERQGPRTGLRRDVLSEGETADEAPPEDAGESEDVMVTLTATPDDTVTECQRIAAALRRCGFVTRQEDVARWTPDRRRQARRYLIALGAYLDQGGDHPSAPAWLVKFYSQEEEIPVATKPKTAKSARRIVQAPRGAMMGADNGRPATTGLKQNASRNGRIPKAKPADAGDEGRVEMIPLGMIFESPENPREDFPKPYLEGLAESLKKNGQLVDCEVRTAVNGAYELVDGACRFRAAKLARFVALRCRIIDVTDEEAIARRGEFDRRENFSPIAKARWYQQMFERCGYSQASLAQKIGCDPSHISNTLRLLKLPDRYRQLVSSGELPATHARMLVPWLKFPSVLQEFDRAFKRFKGDLGSVNEFEDTLESIIDRASRPMLKNGWPAMRFDADEAQREALQIVECRVDWRGKHERAFNVALWEKLNKAAEKSAASRRATKGAGTAKAKGTEKKTLTPAQIKANKAKTAAQFQKRLYAWKIRFLQSRIAKKMASATDQVLLKVLLTLAVSDTSKLREVDLRDAVKEAGGRVTASGPTSEWKTLDSVPDRQVAQVARRVVGQWCARDVADYRAPLRAQHVEAIAAAMFISIKEDWELTEEFLRLHNRAQLAALVKEWGLTGVDAGGKVGALIADLLARRDACPCPKEVLQVKGAQLRKYD